MSAAHQARELRASLGREVLRSDARAASLYFGFTVEQQSQQEDSYESRDLSEPGCDATAAAYLSTMMREWDIRMMLSSAPHLIMQSSESIGYAELLKP